MTYFAAGHNGNIAVTDDPADGWTLDSLDTTEIRAIALTPDYAYAACADGKVFSSASGESWLLAHTFDHPVVRGVYLPWSRDMLFALTDGWIGGLRKGYGWYEWHEWTQVDSGIYDVAGLRDDETPETLEDIRMVMVGGGGRIATADGWYANPGWMQWTERGTPFNGTPILAVARGDNLWVCGGGEGKLAYSENGIDWTLTDSGFDGSCIYTIAFDMALGWLAAGAEGKVSKSLDGIYWDAVDMASESDCAVDYSGRRVDHRWLSAVAAGGCWMVAGDGNVVATLCECPDCYYGENPRTGQTVVFYYEEYTQEYTPLPKTVTWTVGVDAYRDLYVAVLLDGSLSNPYSTVFATPTDYYLAGNAAVISQGKSITTISWYGVDLPVIGVLSIVETYKRSSYLEVAAISENGSAFWSYHDFFLATE